MRPVPVLVGRRLAQVTEASTPVRRGIRGAFVHNRLTNATAATVATLIIGLNAYLILDAVPG